MLDIKRIKDDPEGVKAGLRAKEVDCDAQVDRILELDAKRRALILQTETNKAEQNRVSKEIPVRKKAGEDCAPIFQRMAELKSEIARLEERIAELAEDDPLSGIMPRVQEQLQPVEGGEHILTDDRAPVELLGMRVLDEMISSELESLRVQIRENGIMSLLG